MLLVGFSPSQGGEREEEVKAGGENLLLAPLAPQATTKNPLGSEQRLVLFGSGSPSTDCLIRCSELPEVGGRTLSCPSFALMGRRKALLLLEARAGDWLFQKKEEFSRAILERHCGFLSFSGRAGQSLLHTWGRKEDGAWVPSPELLPVFLSCL